jgi:DNA-binding GntR family transcriptional regulator
MMSRRKKPQLPHPSGSMSERAYAHIQGKIASGELKPDAPISEVLLAEELEMSRTPVREAISQLVAEGLLEHIPNRGTLVVQLKRRDISELYELREALEVYAARRVAQLPLHPLDLDRWQSFSDEVLQLKAELEKSGKPELNPEQMQRFFTTDLGFHNMLLHMAANERILKVVNETRLLIRIFKLERPGYDSAALDTIHQHHRAIIQAVRDRDPEHAAKLLTEHIRNSLAERLTAYDIWEREAALQKVFENSSRNGRR